MPFTSTQMRLVKARSARLRAFTSALMSGKVSPSVDKATQAYFLDLRQCLIYDSCQPNARLIGVEYMIPRNVYEKLDAEEQKLWHSHEFEVQSGMLILPAPQSHKRHEDTWENLETEAMKEVVGLYGKTYHLWQVDRGDEVPLGTPKLMGSLTESKQLNIDEALRDRNKRFDVDHRSKAEVRKDILGPGVHENADSWWREAREARAGIYA